MSYNTVRKSFGVINLLKQLSEQDFHSCLVFCKRCYLQPFLHLILKQTADEIIVLRMIYF